MDNFIIKNDAWLQYLPIIIYGLIIIIVSLLVIIGFLVYRKIMNQDLRSRKRKSAFAMAYQNDLQLSTDPPYQAPLKTEVQSDKGDYAVRTSQATQPKRDRLSNVDPTLNRASDDQQKRSIVSTPVLPSDRSTNILPTRKHSKFVEPNTGLSGPLRVPNSAAVLELYFEYEDAYRI